MKKISITLVAILLLFLSSAYSQEEKSYNKIKKDCYDYTDRRTFTVAGYIDGKNEHSSISWGEEWEEVFDAPYEINMVSMFAYSRLGTGSVALSGSYPGGKIFRSVDYGHTWSLVLDTPYSYVYDFCHLGKGIVLATAGNTSGSSAPIYRSINDGATWSSYSSIPEMISTAIIYIGNSVVICGSGDVVGQTTNPEHIYRSTNNGQTFTAVYTGSSYSLIRDIVNLGKGVILASDDKGQIFRSVDRGLNWSVAYNTSSQIGFTFASSGNGKVLLGTSGGKIFRSLDYGATWELAVDTSSVQIRDIIYCGGGVYIACADNLSTSVPVYKSVDNGYTWVIAKMLPSVNIPAMVNLGHGAFCASTGTDGKIHRSEAW